MAKRIKPATKAQRWKVVSGLRLTEIESACEEWTGKGWVVFAILGPYSDGLAIVLKRLAVL